MSISAAYATPAEYRRVTGMTDPAADAEIAVDLIAVSRYLDGEMRRFFTRDSVATVRVYAPQEETEILDVDDISAAPVQIRVDVAGDGTFARTLPSTDFELLPRNALRGPELWPFTQIALTPLSTIRRFPMMRRVEITAQWGWPAVPDAIRRTTIHITAILRLETPRATKRIAELGDTIETSYQAQNIVKQIANQYKRWLF